MPFNYRWHLNEPSAILPPKTEDWSWKNSIALPKGRVGGGKPSVVQIRGPDVDPDSIGRAVIAALRQMADDLESGALITVDPSRTRMRRLPLGPK